MLGLDTGSSPISIYKEFVRLHEEDGLSFKNVITFNLDEYYPMQPNELQSYVRFMNEHLFDDFDIDRSNINIPDGTIAKNDIQTFCKNYELRIEESGGIDIQLLGMGRTGHIGFNEPGSLKGRLYVVIQYFFKHNLILIAIVEIRLLIYFCTFDKFFF